MGGVQGTTEAVTAHCRAPQVLMTPRRPIRRAVMGPSGSARPPGGVATASESTGVSVASPRVSWIFLGPGLSMPSRQ